MKVEIITNTDKLKDLKEEWEELEKQESEATVFQTFLYNYIWWRTVENLNKYELCIVVVREENNKLLGIAPFVIEKQKKFFLQIRILKFMAWGDYLGVLLNTNNTSLGRIMSKIFECIENLKIEKVLLSNIDISTSLGKFLKKHQKYSYLMEFQTECPYILFSKYENYDKFKLKFLSSSVKKQKNKMKKEVSYKFDIKNNKEDNLYNAIKKIHKNLKNYLNNKNKNFNRKSIYENNEKNIFLENYYKNSEYILNFSLKQDQEIIIYDTCYYLHNRLVSWNMAHLSEYENYNPGRVINYEIMKWGFEQNNDKLIFDFGCGGYPWKFQWTEDFTIVYKLEYIISNSIKIKIYEKLRYIKRGLECFLKVFKI